MITQIDPTRRDRARTAQRRQTQHHPLGHGTGRMRLCRVGPVPEQQEQGQVDAEEGDKLGVRRRHAVAFAVHLPRPLFLDVPLHEPVGGLAAHLAREHEQDLQLARAPQQRSVGDAEALGDEGEEGAEVGEAVGWVLEIISKKGFGARQIFLERVREGSHNERV